MFALVAIDICTRVYVASGHKLLLNLREKNRSEIDSSVTKLSSLLHHPTPVEFLLHKGNLNTSCIDC